MILETTYSAIKRTVNIQKAQCPRKLLNLYTN